MSIILVQSSKMHVHLAWKDFSGLFPHLADQEKIPFKRALVVAGEYVSNLRVSVIYNGHTFERVPVLGPTRSYSQAEFSARDFEACGDTPYYGNSGSDLDKMPTCLVSTEWGQVYLPAFVPYPHLHAPSEYVNVLSELGYPCKPNEIDMSALRTDIKYRGLNLNPLDVVGLLHVTDEEYEKKYTDNPIISIDG
jgi:propanediol utilization protein